ncbi:hypothetical protein A4G20_10280 [Pasteurellaceae bacterium RH1A]|nr:hypothetical protein A4G20_10280 [Pasteurellaceae bacterium RH1A]
MRKPLLKLTLLAGFCLNLTACGTILSATSEQGLSIYSGTQRDFQALQAGGVTAVLAALDLPLSFALDTLLLPVTLSK